jgi:hypothetical protein
MIKILGGMLIIKFGLRVVKISPHRPFRLFEAFYYDAEFLNNMNVDYIRSYIIGWIQISFILEKGE